MKSCANNARQFLDACSFDASVPACNDPRLKEIANYNVQSTPEIQKIEPELPLEESIPSEENISNKDEKINIGNLSLEIKTAFLTSAPPPYTGEFIYVQVHFTLENLGDSTEYVNANNFRIIDEKGDKWNASDLINEQNPEVIEKLEPHEKISTILYSHSSSRENNILEINYDGNTRFIYIK